MPSRSLAALWEPVRLRLLAQARRTTAGQPSLFAALRAKAGRGAEIRTRDLLNPIQARCQTALRPVWKGGIVLDAAD